MSRNRKDDQLPYGAVQAPMNCAYFSRPHDVISAAINLLDDAFRPETSGVLIVGYDDNIADLRVS